ncbi:YihY/virulence factor BrkB family protein [Halapricum sp. CBA1109]|uniref:YihY/virulence factor BrkB family protein n=1 Tax=Halapricum sp. CBA1109 TaxID=2668068 RepID=UPI0012F9EA37|nr:YihY/virulence factor BrkB family protein [Halapricum sp. CBA1109]MUV90880.1 YihY/virulence factor BrkB family protein [Halapricum sp. CBA1109]
MNVDVRRVERVVRAMVHETRVEKIPFLAGSIAYHAFVSLLPLFGLLLYVASGLGNATLETGLIRLGRAIFTEGTQDLLVAEMRAASQSTGLSLLGIGVLVWGTLRIFRGLDTAFSDIYETEAANSFLDQLADGALVLVTFAVGVALSLAVFRLLPSGGVGDLLEPIVLVAGLTLTLLPMYYVFPDTDVSVLEVLPGTAFAAAGLAVFQAGFQVYVRSGEQNVVGGILLLLTWLYVSGLVVLLGVVLNAVLSNRSADVSIRPVVGGVSPLSGGGDWNQTELTHALSTLDARIDARTPLGIDVDGERIDLPAPQRVEIATDESLLGMGTKEMALTLRWIPRADEKEPDERDS